MLLSATQLGNAETPSWYLCECQTPFFPQCPVGGQESSTTAEGELHPPKKWPRRCSQPLDPPPHPRSPRNMSMDLHSMDCAQESLPSHLNLPHHHCGFPWLDLSAKCQCYYFYYEQFLPRVNFDLCVFDLVVLHVGPRPGIAFVCAVLSHSSIPTPGHGNFQHISLEKSWSCTKRYYFIIRKWMCSTATINF